MPIDTRDKRASAIQLALPWRGLWPAPDGAFNQGDRQQIAALYRGVLAGAVALLPEVLVATTRLLSPARTTALLNARTTKTLNVRTTDLL